MCPKAPPEINRAGPYCHLPPVRPGNNFGRPPDFPRRLLWNPFGRFTCPASKPRLRARGCRVLDKAAPCPFLGVFSVLFDMGCLFHLKLELGLTHQAAKTVNRACPLSDYSSERAGHSGPKNAGGGLNLFDHRQCTPLQIVYYRMRCAGLLDFDHDC